MASQKCRGFWRQSNGSSRLNGAGNVKRAWPSNVSEPHCESIAKVALALAPHRLHSPPVRYGSQHNDHGKPTRCELAVVVGVAGERPSRLRLRAEREAA